MWLKLEINALNRASYQITYFYQAIREAKVQDTLYNYHFSVIEINKTSKTKKIKRYFFRNSVKSNYTVPDALQDSR